MLPGNTLFHLLGFYIQSPLLCFGLCLSILCCLCAQVPGRQYFLKYVLCQLFALYQPEYSVTRVHYIIFFLGCQLFLAFQIEAIYFVKHKTLHQIIQIFFYSSVMYVLFILPESFGNIAWESALPILEATNFTILAKARLSFIWCMLSYVLFYYCGVNGFQIFVNFIKTVFTQFHTFG